MNLEDFIKCLKLENKILSIILSNEDNEEYVEPKYFCIIEEIDKLQYGRTLKISSENLKCPGSSCGSGFNDENPKIPGGFEYFLSYGKGEGFPKGERIKKTPEIGKEMFNNQPKNVLNKDFILVKHFEKSDQAISVILKVNPDQLAALSYLFNYESSNYDRVYLSVSSACASVFRMPLYEAINGNKRGVISNMDIISRIFTKKEELYFTVPGSEFKKMLKNADNSFLITEAWKKIRNRIKN